MDDREQLNAFLEKADELIYSKYIFADAKLAGLLKTVALLPSVLKLMESCLKDFDFEKVFTESFVGSEDNSLISEYRAPTSTRDMIALVFTVLIKIDSGEIDLGLFMKSFFYGDGSLFNSYTAFIEEFVKPFRNAVKLIFEGLEEGRLGKNTETPAPARQIRQGFAVMRKRKLPQSDAVDERAIDLARRLLRNDESALMASGESEERLALALGVTSGFLAALDESDRPRIQAAFAGYKFMCEGMEGVALNAEKIEKILKGGGLI